MKTEHFLERTLGLLVRDPEFSDRYLAQVPEDFFAAYPLISRFVVALRYFRETFRSHPAVADLIDVATAEPLPGLSSPDDQEFSDLVELLFRVDQEFDVSIRPWVEARLEAELMRLATMSAIREASLAVQSEEFTRQDVTDLMESVKRVEQISLHRDLGSSIVHDREKRWERRLNEARHVTRVPTGFPWLDETMKGGVPPKTLCVISARPKLGKSAALVHIAKYALLYGFPVLFVSLELSKEFIEDRFDASLTRTPMNYLLENRQLVDDRWALWHPKKDEDIVVVGASARKFDLSRLDYTLDSLRLERGFVPKVIIVDYADLMASEREYTERRFEIEHNYIGLRSVAQERDAIMWTASQINREGENKRQAGLANLAEGDVKGQTADLVVSLNQNMEQKAKNIIHLFISGSRLGESLKSAGEYVEDLVTMNLVHDSAILGTKLNPISVVYEEEETT